MRNEATGPLSGLLGRSTAMKSLRDEIARVGPSDLRIHIRGETGTGKEQVARALHAISPRARVPLVPFNAAGVSTTIAPRKRMSLRRSTEKLSAMVTIRG